MDKEQWLGLLRDFLKLLGGALVTNVHQSCGGRRQSRLSLRADA